MSKYNFALGFLYCTPFKWSASLELNCKLSLNILQTLNFTIHSRRLPICTNASAGERAFNENVQHCYDWHLSLPIHLCYCLTGLKSIALSFRSSLTSQTKTKTKYNGRKCWCTTVHLRFDQRNGGNDEPNVTWTTHRRSVAHRRRCLWARILLWRFRNY